MWNERKSERQGKPIQSIIDVDKQLTASVRDLSSIKSDWWSSVTSLCVMERHTLCRTNVCFGEEENDTACVLVAITWKNQNLRFTASDYLHANTHNQTTTDLIKNTNFPLIKLFPHHVRAYLFFLHQCWARHHSTAISSKSLVFCHHLHTVYVPP